MIWSIVSLAISITSITSHKEGEEELTDLGGDDFVASFLL